MARVFGAGPLVGKRAAAGMMVGILVADWVVAVWREAGGVRVRERPLRTGGDGGV